MKPYSGKVPPKPVRSPSKKKQTFAQPITFTPIGVIHTAFKEKFGIPRQSGLASQARGVIELRNEDGMRLALKFLDSFSHLWLIFVFHEHQAKNWKPTIRPPRLGGAKKVGVLASRSPHRPNPIGLSAVKLEHVEIDHPDGPRIHVSGVDLLDGTPILDIKPYIDYADEIPNTVAGWAKAGIDRVPVHFTEQAETSLAEREKRHPELRRFVVEMLELDPRPASHRRKFPVGEPQSDGKEFGFNLFDYDVKWMIRKDAFWVIDIDDLVDGKPKSTVK